MFSCTDYLFIVIFRVDIVAQNTVYMYIAHAIQFLNSNFSMKIFKFLSETLN